MLFEALFGHVPQMSIELHPRAKLEEELVEIRNKRDVELQLMHEAQEGEMEQGRGQVHVTSTTRGRHGDALIIFTTFRDH